MAGRSINNKGKTVDGYKLNKFAGAVLLAVLIIMGIKEVNNALNTPEGPAQTAYVIEGVEEATAVADAGEPVEAAPYNPTT